MKINKSGISLIVLVVTLIIMVVLASVVIISLNNTRIITLAEDASEGFYSGAETEQNVLSSLLDLLEEKLPNKNGGSGNNTENPNMGTTQEEKEEFLKTKLLEHDGDVAIDEYGNIIDLSLWHVVTDDDGSCIIWRIEDPYPDLSLHPAYSGNIVNGKLQDNIPAFVKKMGTYIS